MSWWARPVSPRSRRAWPESTARSASDTQAHQAGRSVPASLRCFSAAVRARSTARRSLRAARVRARRSWSRQRAAGFLGAGQGVVEDLGRGGVVVAPGCLVGEVAQEAGAHVVVPGGVGVVQAGDPVLASV